MNRGRERGHARDAVSTTGVRFSIFPFSGRGREVEEKKEKKKRRPEHLVPLSIPNKAGLFSSLSSLFSFSGSFSSPFRERQREEMEAQRAAAQRMTALLRQLRDLETGKYVFIWW